MDKTVKDKTLLCVIRLCSEAKLFHFLQELFP